MFYYLLFFLISCAICLIVYLIYNYLFSILAKLDNQFIEKRKEHAEKERKEAYYNKQKNMQYNKEAMIDETASIFRTYKLLGAQGLTGFPLVDRDKKLTGYVNVKQISKYLIEGDFNYICTSYDNILEALNGTLSFICSLQIFLRMK